MFSTKYKKLSYLPKFLVRSMVMVSSQKLSKHMYTYVMIFSVWLVLKQNVDFILLLNYVALWSSLTIIRINFLTFLRYWQHESRDGGSRRLVVSHVWLPLGYLDVDFSFFTSKWHSILYQLCARRGHDLFHIPLLRSFVARSMFHRYDVLPRP